MPSLGDLTVQIGANTKGLDSGANRAESRLKKLDRTMGRVVRRAGQIGGAVAIAGTAITAHLVNKSIRAAKEIQNLSDVANASVAEFQRQAFAAKTVGIESEKLADIYKDVNDRVGDFLTTGGGPMADFFETIGPKVGVTAEQFARLSGPQAMQLYVSSLEKANVSQQEMTFFMEAMASDATRLLPLLRNGGEAMENQAQKADRLGVALSNIEAEQLTRASIAMEQTASVVDGIGNTLAVELSPVLEGVVNKFTDMTEETNGWKVAVKTSVDVGVRMFGFLADVLEGIKRTFQILGRGAAAFGLTLKAGMLTAAQAILDGPVDKINTLIEQLNKIPGVNIGLVTGIDSEVDQAMSALRIARNDMADILKEPMPSEGIQEWVKEQRAASREAAEAAIANKEKQRDRTLEIDNQMTEAEREGRERKLEQLRQHLMSERQAEIANHKQRMEWLEKARESELITEQKFHEMKENLKSQHEDRLSQIEKDAMTQREKFEAASMSKKVSILSRGLQEMTQATASKNKAMFRINKAAAISSATVDAIKGAEKTWGAYPYPWNIPMTAAHVAGSVARLSSLASQSFGGGGTAPSATSAGTGAPAGSQPVNQVGGGGPTRQISIEGVDPDQMFSGRQVRNLIERINEEQEDGSALITVGG